MVNHVELIRSQGLLCDLMNLCSSFLPCDGVVGDQVQGLDFLDSCFEWYTGIVFVCTCFLLIQTNLSFRQIVLQLLIRLKQFSLS